MSQYEIYQSRAVAVSVHNLFPSAKEGNITIYYQMPVGDSLNALISPTTSPTLNINLFPPSHFSRNYGASDRHDYHHRSRSADQRSALERPMYSRSRSTERPPDVPHLRSSMPSLPSGNSAPPSPALSR